MTDPASTPPQSFKKILESKTIWMNLLGIAVLAVQMKTGWAFPPEYQMMVLTGVNMLLRTITKDQIDWSV